jgi:chemotaxis protein methyltransferase CheR
MTAISDEEFAQFRRFIHAEAGISLADSKKALVSGRLAKRLNAHRMSSFTDYLRLLDNAQASHERQTAVDLLTTNETYFFREPRHFAFLADHVRSLCRTSAPFRVWSAAGSTGEEAYSIAMVLEDCIPGRWEVLASDISSRVLEYARSAHYSTARLENLPSDYLQRFCLKGQDAQDGTLLIQRRLRQTVRFQQINLNATLPRIGPFDLVFLRNVLIYFNPETKRDVVSRVLETLAPGGYLLIGHSDSLAEVDSRLEPVAPAIYRLKPGIKSD